MSEIPTLAEVVDAADRLWPLRTQQSWPRLADALMDADEVLLLDIAAASETPIPGIHATLITERMRENGHAGVGYRPDRAELLSELRRTAAAGDILVTMGAGDVWKLARELAGEGFDLVLVARSRDKLEQLAQELKKDKGAKVTVLPADLNENLP